MELKEDEFDFLIQLKRVCHVQEMMTGSLVNQHSDFHLSLCLKKFLDGQSFDDDDKRKNALS